MRRFADADFIGVRRCADDARANHDVVAAGGKVVTCSITQGDIEVATGQRIV